MFSDSPTELDVSYFKSLPTSIPCFIHLLLLSILYYLIFNSLGVLDCWLDKTSNLKTSLELID